MVRCIEAFRVGEMGKRWKAKGMFAANKNCNHWISAQISLHVSRATARLEKLLKRKRWKID